MERKTEFFGDYNNNDFVQKDGDLQELTVLITLSEYRDLIRTLATREAYIEQLKAEKEELNQTVEGLRRCLAAIKLPEWAKKLSHIFSEEQSSEDEESMEGDETGNG